MATPDVRVRLSAEGVQEVVSALNRVGSKAGESTKKAAEGTWHWNEALKMTKELLVGLGVVTSVGGVLEFVKNTAEAVHAMDIMSQRLGTNIQNVQLLQLAFKRANVELEGSSRSLGKFNTLAEQAAVGKGAGIKPLEAIGLSKEEIASLGDRDLLGKLQLLADHLDKIPDSGAKTAAIMALVGTRGMALIPVFKELADGGAERLRGRLQQLGATIDSDVAGKTTQMMDEFEVLKSQMTGIASNFVGELAPSVLQATTAIENSVAGTADDVKFMADVIAFPFKVLVGVLLEVPIIIGGVFKTILHITEAFYQGLARAASGDWFGAVDAFVAEISKVPDTIADANIRGTRVWKDLFAETVIEHRKIGEGFNVDLQTLWRERTEAQRTALAAETAGIRANAKLRATEEQNALEDSLRSTSAYYDNRRAIVLKATADEIAVLERRLALESSQPDADQAANDTAKTQAEIDAKRLESRQELAELDRQEAKAYRSIEDQQIALLSRIYDLQGKTHTSRMAQIDREVDNRRRELEAAGELAGTPEERNARLAELRTRLVLEADINEQERRFNEEMARYQRERHAIENKQEAGLIDELTARQQILDLEKSRLPVLQGISAEISKLAETGSPEQKAKAEDVSLAVEDMGLAIQASEFSLTQFRATAEDALDNGFTEFLSRGIVQAENFGAAVIQMTRNVADAILSMLSKVLASKAISALFSLFGQSTAAFDQQFSFEQVTSHASGGAIPNAPMFAPLPGGDNRLAFVKAGEFVTRTEVMRQPGALEFAHEFNRKGMAALRTARLPRFSDGGPVGGATVDKPVSSAGVTDIVVGLDDGLLLKSLRSPAGQRVIVKTVMEHERTIRGRH